MALFSKEIHSALLPDSAATRMEAQRRPPGPQDSRACEPPRPQMLLGKPTSLAPSSRPLGPGKLTAAHPEDPVRGQTKGTRDAGGPGPCLSSRRGDHRRPRAGRPHLESPLVGPPEGASKWSWNGGSDPSRAPPQHTGPLTAPACKGAQNGRDPLCPSSVAEARLALVFCGEAQPRIPPLPMDVTAAPASGAPMPPLPPKFSQGRAGGAGLLPGLGTLPCLAQPARVPPEPSPGQGTVA